MNAWEELRAQSYALGYKPQSMINPREMLQAEVNINFREIN